MGLATYTSIAHNVVDHAERHGFPSNYLKYLRKVHNFNRKRSTMNATQNHIQYLTTQINPLHQTSRDERLKLAEWEDEKDFSILGELEILAGLLQGYAGQLITDRLEQPQTAIGDLHHRNPFEIPELAAWYFTHGKDYPKLCRYLELLDYLRLSLLGAIQQTSLQAA